MRLSTFIVSVRCILGQRSRSLSVTTLLIDIIATGKEDRVALQDELHAELLFSQRALGLARRSAKESPSTEGAQIISPAHKMFAGEAQNFLQEKLDIKRDVLYHLIVYFLRDEKSQKGSSVPFGAEREREYSKKKLIAARERLAKILDSQSPGSQNKISVEFVVPAKTLEGTDEETKLESSSRQSSSGEQSCLRHTLGSSNGTILRDISEISTS